MNIIKARTIFIVDDDMMLTEALSDYLSRNADHRISVFHTGEECIKKLSENPEVIVLDYYLNTVEKNAASGLEILSVIRKHCPSAHVIMLSSQESYNNAMQTLKKGAEDYVIKDEIAFEKIAKLINEMN